MDTRVYIVIGVVLLVILISMQYTMNKILVLLKEIKILLAELRNKGKL